eukprot:TRINITY_DN2320_c0_g1_i2.p1 TRINITY_DN2320_c0_g1~~TRINITY_DN2320_c0_g1_i2.p1  ORF type:complete len:1391 (-),score=125.64 TRINITY_DN2320_c0_g1_i2:617-4789(-)
MIMNLSTRESSLHRYNLIMEGQGGDLNKIKEYIGTERRKLEPKKKMGKKNEGRCRLGTIIAQSRKAFGICEPRERLKANEVFFQTMVEGKPVVLKNEVIICRNPCYHPGDIRKLWAVDIPEYRHLRECVVFSVQGDRPVADQSSGGDLDGDMFFICWDEELIPKDDVPAADYSAPPSKYNSDVHNGFEQYFIEQCQKYPMIGILDGLYRELAAINTSGANSQDCKELNLLFSREIDSVGLEEVEEKLQAFRKKIAEQGSGIKMVWDKLVEMSEEGLSQLKQQNSSDLPQEPRKIKSSEGGSKEEFEHLYAKVMKMAEDPIARRDPDVDAKFQTMYQSMILLPTIEDSFRSRLQELKQCIAGLPIYNKKHQFLEALKRNSVVILKAGTGSGKSTQAIQYICDFYANGREVVCTEPRRNVARNIAITVSEQRGEGDPSKNKDSRVAYKYKGEMSLNLQTKNNRVTMKFITDGSLANCGAVPDILIIDEIHERNIHMDILLALFKREFVINKNCQKKLVIISATINPQTYEDYFKEGTGGACTVETLEIPGATNQPVEEYYLESEKTTQLINSVHPEWKRSPDQYVEEAVRLCVGILRYEPGHILVFLPGKKDIEEACQRLRTLAQQNDISVQILPYYASLPQDKLNKIRSLNSKDTSVIFATNYAESSLTINDLKYVIDCGRSRVLNYKTFGPFNIKSLSPGFEINITKRSADQRRGRVGRTSPGVCFKLYPKTQYEQMKVDVDADIANCDFLGPFLKLLSISGLKFDELDFLDPPKFEGRFYKETLMSLGAVDEDCKITQEGRKMLRFGDDVETAKFILNALGMGCDTHYVAIIASFLIADLTNLFTCKAKELPGNLSEYLREEGDMMTLLKMYERWSDVEKPELKFINEVEMKKIKKSVVEIEKTIEKAHRSKYISSTCPADGTKQFKLLCKALASAFFTKISLAKNKNKPKFGFTTLTPGCKDTLYASPRSVIWMNTKDIDTVFCVCNGLETRGDKIESRLITRIKRKWVYKYAKDWFMKFVGEGKQLLIKDIGQTVISVVSKKLSLEWPTGMVTDGEKVHLILHADRQPNQTNIILSGRRSNVDKALAEIKSVVDSPSFARFLFSDGTLVAINPEGIILNGKRSPSDKFHCYKPQEYSLLRTDEDSLMLYGGSVRWNAALKKLYIEKLEVFQDIARKDGDHKSRFKQENLVYRIFLNTAETNKCKVAREAIEEKYKGRVNINNQYDEQILQISGDASHEAVDLVLELIGGTLEKCSTHKCKRKYCGVTLALCGHVFCRECIRDKLRASRSLPCCPSCSGRLMRSDYSLIFREEEFIDYAKNLFGFGLSGSCGRVLNVIELQASHNKLRASNFRRRFVYFILILIFIYICINYLTVLQLILEAAAKVMR